MSWVRLDDGINDHPKVAALNHEEFHLWVSALVLAHRQLYADLDAPPGILTDAQVRGLARMKRCQYRAVVGLVEHGLFEGLEGGGVRLHDFEQHLAPDWEARRGRLREVSESRRNAGRLGGQQSVAARLAKFGTAQPKQTPKQAIGFASGTEQPSARPPRSKTEAPVPVPVPVRVRGAHSRPPYNPPPSPAAPRPDRRQLAVLDEYDAYSERPEEVRRLLSEALADSGAYRAPVAMRRWLALIDGASDEMARRVDISSSLVKRRAREFFRVAAWSQRCGPREAALFHSHMFEQVRTTKKKARTAVEAGT